MKDRGRRILVVSTKALSVAGTGERNGKLFGLRNLIQYDFYFI
jgi:hypothetical protein